MKYIALCNPVIWSTILSIKNRTYISGRPYYIRSILLHIFQLQLLLFYPRSLALLKRSRDNIKDPLFRFFDREVKMGAGILNLVRADLRELEEICSGEKRQTNHHR